MRIPIALALLALWFAPAPASAQEAPAKPASAKTEKVRRLLKAMKWRENLETNMRRELDRQEGLGALPGGFTAKFFEVADMGELEKMVVGFWEERADEATLDAGIAFYESEIGGRLAGAQGGVESASQEGIQGWAMAASMKTMQKIMGGEEEPEEPVMEVAEAEEEPEAPEDGKPVDLITQLKNAKIASNETAAIATLRFLCSAQAQMQTVAKIDCDRDGVGEYGTLAEMAGSAPVRTAPDYSSSSTPMSPSVLSAKFTEVDGDGIVRKSGYCFRVFLPDATTPTAGFVHEAGTREKPALSGPVSVDLSETNWCAYAWPEKIGESGNRVFFTNQGGDITQSLNEERRWEGTTRPVSPEAAFVRAGITSQIAVGTVGRDGELWRAVH